MLRLKIFGGKKVKRLVDMFFSIRSIHWNVIQKVSFTIIFCFISQMNNAIRSYFSGRCF